MIRSLRIVPFVALLAVVGGGCAPQDEGIELQLFTATYDTAPEAPPPEGWQRVSFEGNLRSRPVAVLVSDEPLLTGWHIVALRVALFLHQPTRLETPLEPGPYGGGEGGQSVHRCRSN